MIFSSFTFKSKILSIMFKVQYSIIYFTSTKINTFSRFIFTGNKLYKEFLKFYPKIKNPTTKEIGLAEDEGFAPFRFASLSRQCGKQPFHRLFGCKLFCKIRVVFGLQLPTRSSPTQQQKNKKEIGQPISFLLVHLRGLEPRTH